MGLVTKGYTAVTADIPSAAEWNALVDPLYTEVNGSLDEANVDLTGSDGIVGKSTAQTITGTKTFTDIVVNGTLETTENGGSGVQTALELEYDPADASVADNDGVALLFSGDNDAATPEKTVYGEIDAVFTDVSDGTEDGRLDIKAMVAGTLSTLVSLKSAGHTFYDRQAAAAAVKDMLTLDWDPASGTPADGQGVGISFKMSDSASNQDEFGSIDIVADDVTSTSEDATLKINLITAGTVQESLTITDGNMSFRGAATIDTSGNNALTINTGTANLAITCATMAVTGAATISSTLGVTGAATLSSTLAVTGLITATAGITSGSTIKSDTADTDDLGTSTVPWRALFLTGGYANPIRISTLRLWYDSTNAVLRVKHGSDPSSETDGNILMEG